MKNINRKTGHLFAGGSVLALSLLASTSSIAGSIVGTAHDLSANGYSGGEICVVCHTPHAADISVSTAPLWNHAITTATFTMYSSPSLDATQDAQPTGTSKLCLSCHDGVTAIDSFGGNVGTIFMTNAAKAVGLDGLANDHPISIVYDTTLSQLDPGLHDPAVQTVTIGAGGDKTRTGTVNDMMLSAGKVQCTSCHDVHNNFVGPGTNDQPFLKVTKAGSQICLTCHNK
ncbi:Cytochrome c family protein [hydrothermal vent metagenome]|uniref:Cytochrome c family protein n=1 Tax=hydrothermal vent metagenome TaxID=652676 RepID=A0A3B0X583_9ZZZZ